MHWQLAAVLSATIMVAYGMISFTVFRGLVRSGQVRSNRLGIATASIFASCAAGHGYHLLHLMIPFVHPDAAEGLAMRAAYDWHLIMVDLVTAIVAIWYWTLRSTYAAVLQGPMLFEDLKERQRQALEINDHVVQGLAVVKYALERGDAERAAEAADVTLEHAREIITGLLGDPGSPTRLGPGDLVRADPATLRPSHG